MLHGKFAVNRVASARQKLFYQTRVEDANPKLHLHALFSVLSGALRG